MNASGDAVTSGLSERNEKTLRLAQNTALIGCYVAEHSNAATVKHFMSNFEQGCIGEGTMWLFMNRGSGKMCPCGRGSNWKGIAIKPHSCPLWWEILTVSSRLSEKLALH